MFNEDGQRLSYVKSNGVNLDELLPAVKTFPEALKYFAETQRGKDAFVFVTDEGRVSVSWNELYCRAVSVARAMVYLGVKINDFVVVYLNDSPEWLYAVFGAMLAGACPVPFYYVDYSWENVLTILKRLEKCSMIIVGVDNEKRPIHEMLGQVTYDGVVKCDVLPYLRYLICHDTNNTGIKYNGKSLQSLITYSKTEVELPVIHEDDVSITSMSSGSTGPAKVIGFTNKALILSCKSRYLDLKQFTGKETFVEFNARPFAWSGGYPRSVITGHCRVTCTTKTTPDNLSFRMKKIIETIQNERCTFVAMQPSDLCLFAKDFKAPDNWPVKVVRQGGQPATLKSIGLLGSFTPVIQFAYSASECKHVASYYITNVGDFTRSKVGKIVSYIQQEVKIVDESGRTVPIGEHGEVYVRSEGQFKGFVNDPEKTSKYMTPDGWCRTDDIGMLTEENDLYVYSRKSNVIITDQNSVEPELLEKSIETLNPDLENVIIVPIADDILYQSLCACVILRDGCELDIEHMNKQMQRLQTEKPADFKAVPKHWLVIDHVPLLSNGKPSRTELAKIARARLDVKSSV